MNTDETAALPSRTELDALAGQLKASARAVAGLARAVQRADPQAITKALKRLDQVGLGAQVGSVEQAPVVERVRRWLVEEEAQRGPRLTAALRALCSERGLGLTVVTRQPLELRIPPLSVAVDIEHDQVEVGFGREVVERSGARADDVMKAWDRARRTLEGKDWKPRDFHERLYRAWRRTTADGWVELHDVLPEVALLVQPKRFRRDPSARNFQPYPRAQFAYDLWRLRRDRCLAHNGWRLVLGSATGGSTRDKKRVFWLEDADGNGQYYLTLRFVQEGGGGG